MHSTSLTAEQITAKKVRLGRSLRFYKSLLYWSRRLSLFFLLLTPVVIAPLLLKTQATALSPQETLLKLALLVLIPTPVFGMVLLLLDDSVTKGHSAFATNKILVALAGVIASTALIIKIVGGGGQAPLGLAIIAGFLVLHACYAFLFSSANQNLEWFESQECPVGDRAQIQGDHVLAG